MMGITGLARNTEHTVLRNVSPMIHGGALMPDMSSGKKPPTQLFTLTCISRNSAFESGHAMLLFLNFFVTVTYVTHAAERVRRWTSLHGLATNDPSSSPRCRR